METAPIYCQTMITPQPRHLGSKAADVERIEATLPPTAVAGTRSDELQMRVLDSER